MKNRMSGSFATSTRSAFFLLMTFSLQGCASSDSLSYTADSTAADQKYPANYRPELLALMRTYLNDPHGVRDAMIAEPVQHKVSGRQRYIACLRYNAREADGSYRGAKERVALFIDGRLDRLIEKPEDLCENANYAPFPELEKITR